MSAGREPAVARELGDLERSYLKGKESVKTPKRARGNSSDSRRQLEGEEDLGGVRGNGEDTLFCFGDSNGFKSRVCTSETEDIF